MPAGHVSTDFMRTCLQLNGFGCILKKTGDPPPSFCLGSPDKLPLPCRPQCFPLSHEGGSDFGETAVSGNLKQDLRPPCPGIEPGTDGDCSHEIKRR